MSCACITAHAQVSARTIENTAHVAYVIGGESHLVPSNTVVTSLVPLIDVTNKAVSAQQDTLPDNQTGYTYSFVIGNPGTSADHYELSAGFTNLSAPVDSLWIDINHNHLFDAGVDVRLDQNLLTLQSGASAEIIVLAGARGTMGLTATSLNNDALAVVRHRSAYDTIGLEFTTPDEVTLTKSQSVDTLGEIAPSSGTLITYSLDAYIPAHADISDAAINDTIPTGTNYVAGSLSFDGVAISDAVDVDAGAYDVTQRVITVALPATVSEATTPSNHTVRFQVRIN
jgi:hypothetical protein